MEQYKQEFIDFMIASDVLKFGDFTLKSGRKSPFFMNAGAYVTGTQLRKLGEYYAKAIHDNYGLDFDVLFGPAYKGIPLSVAATMAISELYGKDVRYCSNRKEAKDHGDTGILLGSRLKDGDRVVIIEDVTTSGKSIEETFPIIRAQADVEIKGLIVSLNRCERGKGEKSALEEIRELYGFPTAAIVFKTISDQYGKYSLVKVVSGKITGDMTLYNTGTGKAEKLGRLYTIRGKKTEEVKEIACGDIGAIAKMDRLKTGDTLCDPKKVVKLAAVQFAEPCYSRAIAPKTRGQDEKVGTGLIRLNEEDPTFSVVNNAETHQVVVSGAGDIQIDVLVSKLKSRFGVEAELDTPRVAYREKIRKKVRKQGRHKKQTGGSGQFGDVHIVFEPQEESEDMIFAEEVFGGSVPKNFFPAVEKGLREACQHGVLAGYPVVFLKATLVDGSYHPVDSSEIAFKTAAQLAYKAALPEASPVLLEPIGELKVTIPDSYMGDIIGDLNKRRGRVMGMTPTGDGDQVVEAEVPMAEMMSYAIDLRSMSQSRGSFTFHFVRYEECPPAAQEKAIAEAKALAEAE